MVTEPAARSMSLHRSAHSSPRRPGARREPQEHAEVDLLGFGGLDEPHRCLGVRGDDLPPWQPPRRGVGGWVLGDPTPTLGLGEGAADDDVDAAHRRDGQGTTIAPTSLSEQRVVPVELRRGQLAHLHLAEVWHEVVVDETTCLQDGLRRPVGRHDRVPLREELGDGDVGTGVPPGAHLATQPRERRLRLALGRRRGAHLPHATRRRVGRRRDDHLPSGASRPDALADVSSRAVDRTFIDKSLTSTVPDRAMRAKSCSDGGRCGTRTHDPLLVREVL